MVLTVRSDKKEQWYYREILSSSNPESYSICYKKNNTAPLAAFGSLFIIISEEVIVTEWNFTIS